MAKPSVILLGSKPASVVALSVMMKRGWKVQAVVVSPKFNYTWLNGPTLQSYCEANGIPVLTSQDQLSRDSPADFVISYMFRYRVKSATLSLARRAALNFHAGPLPEFGGWAFYNIAILEDSEYYGCTCHYMDEGFDTGREELPLEEQDKNRTRYLTREQFEALKEIPVNADAATIDRIARAFWYPPYECAYMQVGAGKVQVVPALVMDQLARLLHADDLESLQQSARPERTTLDDHN